MKMQKWRMSTMACVGVLAAWFVACAGEDIPPIDDELRADVEEKYGDGAGGQLGSAGAGGSGATPRGGSSGAAGSGGGQSQAGGGAAGASVVGGGGTLVVNDCDAFGTIIVARCGQPTCHNSGSAQGDFARGDEQVIFDYVDRPSTVSTCDGRFIDSRNTDDSLLLTKTASPIPQGCGNLQMPLSGALLTDDQTACLQEWLTQFAE